MNHHTDKNWTQVNAEIVVPVYNESHRLPIGFSKLKSWLDENDLAGTKICIADNGSTDGTLSIAEQLSKSTDNTRVVHLPEANLAAALKSAWKSSSSDIIGYCDVDMSTDPKHIREALALLASHPEFLMISASRHLPESSVSGRTLSRKFVSALYAACVKLALGVHFTDSACGFKLLRKSWFDKIAGTLTAENFWLGTELMFIAERTRGKSSYYEIPAHWTENHDSKVHIARATADAAINVIRMRLKHIF